MSEINEVAIEQEKRIDELEDELQAISQLLIGRDTCEDMPDVVAAVLLERSEAQAEVTRLREANDHWHTRIEQMKAENEVLRNDSIILRNFLHGIERDVQIALLPSCEPDKVLEDE